MPFGEFHYDHDQTRMPGKVQILNTFESSFKCRRKAIGTHGETGYRQQRGYRTRTSTNLHAKTTDDQGLTDENLNVVLFFQRYKVAEGTEWWL